MHRIFVTYSAGAHAARCGAAGRGALPQRWRRFPVLIFRRHVQARRVLGVSFFGCSHMQQAQGDANADSLYRPRVQHF
jgi:hypothetical protein